MFGHAASSHTVARFNRRISALVSANPTLVGALTRIQSGLRCRCSGEELVIGKALACPCPSCHPLPSQTNTIAMADFNAMLSGYHRFRADGWTKQRERWEILSRGQSPQVMVIACSDSRVDPSSIFDTSPGEMFVVRNVANLVPPFEMGGGRHGVSAALEFAVTQLEIPEILVMGHGQCGGCRAALYQDFKGARHGEGGFIADWIDLLDEERAKISDRVPQLESDEALLAMEHAAVRVSLRNLRTFSCIRDREADGRIRLHGAFFAIDDGQLSLLDEGSNRFEIV